MDCIAGGERIMLSTSMKLGTQLLGLSTLINSGRPASMGVIA